MLRVLYELVNLCLHSVSRFHLTLPVTMGIGLQEGGRTLPILTLTRSGPYWTCGWYCKGIFKKYKKFYQSRVNVFLSLVYYWVDFIHGAWCGSSSWLMNPSLKHESTQDYWAVVVHGAWCNLDFEHGAILANAGWNNLQWPQRSTLTSLNLHFVPQVKNKGSATLCSPRAQDHDYLVGNSQTREFQHILSVPIFIGCLIYNGLEKIDLMSSKINNSRNKVL